MSTAADVQEQDQQCQPSVQVKDCKPHPLGTGQGGLGSRGLVLRKEKRLHERRVMAESQLEGGTRTKERKRKSQEAQSVRAFSIRSSPCRKENVGVPASMPGGRLGVFESTDLRLRMQLVW